MIATSDCSFLRLAYSSDIRDGVGVTLDQSIVLLGLNLVGVGVDGAAHLGVVIVGLEHDLEQVLGGFLQVVGLREAAGEVLHGLDGVASLQGLIGTVKPATAATKHKL